MPDTLFLIRDAVKSLTDAGLFDGILVPENGNLVFCTDPGDILPEEGFQGSVLDSRQLKAQELFVALEGEHVDGRKFIPEVLQRGHWVLAAPLDGAETYPLSELEGCSHCGIIQSKNPEAALAVLGSTWRLKRDIKVVGITGTNGKTTTKDLLTAMLRGKGKTHATAGNFNNHLGLPLTLLNIKPVHQYAVVEMGASAVGEIEYLANLAAPDVGIITNASEAHLEEFGSLDGIIKGKGELLDNLPAEGLAILNADSPGFDQWKKRASCAVSSFGKGTGDYYWKLALSSNNVDEVSVAGTKFIVPLPGEHNGANLVAALLAARHLGLSDDEIRAGLDGFQGSPHRGIIINIGGRTILDDCYNANPRSILAAVATLLHPEGDGQRFAVLGHMAELGTETEGIHKETGRQMAALGLKHLVVVGPEAKPMVAGFEDTGLSGIYCSSLAEAASYIVSNSLSGDHILIKGSRSAAMERILVLLKDKLERNRGSE